MNSKTRPAENEPLRLAPFQLREAQGARGGELRLIRSDGKEIAVPAFYVPFLNMVVEGHSIAEIAVRLRASSSPWGRFARVGRFLAFLNDNGLLVERRAVQLAEALRSDFAWRDSLAFEHLISIEVFRWRGARAAPKILRVTFLACLLIVFSALMVREIPFRGAREWPSADSAWPALAAFFLVFMIGRSLRAILQLIAIGVTTGKSAAIRLRVESLGVSLATDDVSTSPVNAVSVAASFAILSALALPLAISRFMDEAGTGGVYGYVPFFTLVLLLCDLSPFRRSALTECLRALFSLIDARNRLKAERTIQCLHQSFCLMWLISLGSFVVFGVLPFVKHVLQTVDRGSAANALSLVTVVTVLVFLILSLLDDVAGEFGDVVGGDRWTIRRIWSRKPKSGMGAGVVSDVDRPSREDLERLPMIRQMDSAVRDTLLASAKIVDLKAGAYVCRQNDLDRKLYVLLDGRLRVVKKSSAGRKRTVAFLEPGAVFGEIAFFLGERRAADVTVESKSRLLAIPHDERIASVDRNRSEELQLRIWLLQSLVASPLFRTLPADAFDALTFAGSQKRFRPGEKIISEGERGDACYIIIQGQTSVVQNFVAINKLYAGDAFGEIALFRPDLLRTASIVADTETLCVRIESERFWALISSHLPLAIELERLAEARLSADIRRGSST